MKYLVFRHFSVITLVLLAALLALLVFTDLGSNLPLVGSIAGGIAGFCYFVQGQKLHELRLFKELFTEFNDRYDDMNSALARIGTRSEIDGDRDRLVDYFNLCAEEYLWFREGYILPEVWRAWCRGMAEHFDRAEVQELWDKEAATGSYYGLTIAEIERGADRRLEGATGT